MARDLDEVREIEVLLDRSRKCRYDDPHRMMYLAELALAASERLDSEKHGALQVASVRAQAWAEAANAYRVMDFLDRAERAIDNALNFYESSAREPRVIGLIADRLASLLCHRRRFAESFLLLDRLYGFYRGAGETHLAGRVLIKRGLYAEYAGNPEDAILFTREGLALIDSGSDPGLALAGLHNLMWCLTEMGEHGLVAEQLEVIRPLYGEDRLNVLRLRWVEARVAAGEGEGDRAESLYEEVRSGFQAARLVFPASLVSLELALLWHREEKWRAVRDLAAELVASFQGLQAGREAIVALVLLRRSVERESVMPGEVRARILTAAAVVRGMASPF